MSNVISLRSRSSARSRVAAEVRAEIARAGTNQIAVSKASGIARSTLSRKLSAKTDRDAFDVDELERIAQVLDVPITKFFATADQDPDGGGSSRGEPTNPRPSHYKARSKGSIGHLYEGKPNVVPMRRKAVRAPLRDLPWTG